MGFVDNIKSRLIGLAILGVVLLVASWFYNPFGKSNVSLEEAKWCSLDSPLLQSGDWETAGMKLEGATKRNGEIFCHTKSKVNYLGNMMDFDLYWNEKANAGEWCTPGAIYIEDLYGNDPMNNNKRAKGRNVVTTVGVEERNGTSTCHEKEEYGFPKDDGSVKDLGMDKVEIEEYWYDEDGLEVDSIGV